MKGKTKRKKEKATKKIDEMRFALKTKRFGIDDFIHHEKTIALERNIRSNVIEMEMKLGHMIEILR